MMNTYTRDRTSRVNYTGRKEHIFINIPSYIYIYSLKRILQLKNKARSFQDEW